MRSKSRKTDGFQAFAVSGINTISFGIAATPEARKDLLGFAVERFDPTENERYIMPGFKVFRSVIPNPGPGLCVSTWEHPVQSFVWDDFTAKPDREYEYTFFPLRGTPRNLDRSARPFKIAVHTEPLYSKLEHDVFFNRGVASSQAYNRRFGNKKPNDPSLTKEQQEAAKQWLSRDLDDALLKFIKQAKEGDGLRCCFYEFRYAPAAEALKDAIDRGVDVKIIVDAKENGRTDRDGTEHAAFPRTDNLEVIKKAGIPRNRVVLREARAANIQHNKFMVLLKGQRQRPAEVWTGSTNLSEGGIHGQTNVGHWVRNEDVAERFNAYWELLRADPGGQDGDDAATSKRKNAELKAAVQALTEVPATIEEIPQGVTPVFSPRSGLKVLDLYVSLVDSAAVSSCITLAFGISAVFKEQLKNNPPDGNIVLMLLEKEDRPNPRSTKPFIPINARNNVYKAWGSFLRDPVYQWAKETNARALELNSHVAYVHSKFLLMDPLGDDPIVVTGSANFSAPSTDSNDENMLIIRGDRRVADIYFTEFNRLFNHYYFRAVTEAISRRPRSADAPAPAGTSAAAESLFLNEKDVWTEKYQPGKLKQKRLDLYTGMEGFTNGG